MFSFVFFPRVEHYYSTILGAGRTNNTPKASTLRHLSVLASRLVFSAASSRARLANPGAKGPADVPLPCRYLTPPGATVSALHFDPSIVTAAAAALAPTLSSLVLKSSPLRALYTGRCSRRASMPTLHGPYYTAHPRHRRLLRAFYTDHTPAVPATAPASAPRAQDQFTAAATAHVYLDALLWLLQSLSPRLHAQRGKRTVRRHGHHRHLLRPTLRGRWHAQECVVTYPRAGVSVTYTSTWNKSEGFATKIRISWL